MEKTRKIISIPVERYDELIGFAAAYGVLRDSILQMSDMIDELDSKDIKQEIDSCVWFIGQKEGGNS